MKSYEPSGTEEAIFDSFQERQLSQGKVDFLNNNDLWKVNVMVKVVMLEI